MLRQFVRFDSPVTLISLAAFTVASALLVYHVIPIVQPITGQVTAQVLQPTPSSAPVIYSPNGPIGNWSLAFDDEFDGTKLDTAKWVDASTAESDAGHGNLDNGQLEWNQAANCAVGNGVLALTAKRQQHTSAAGNHYYWTSCLLTTAPSYAFQYGYIEERSQLPTVQGFWPAFWTWQAPGVNSWLETDVYGYYSDNRDALYLTQHNGSSYNCQAYKPPFDPSTGFHTYGADIEAGGTTWYIDGLAICHTHVTSGGMTNLITNLAVYAAIPPPDSIESATQQIDYIRAWQH